MNKKIEKPVDIVKRKLWTFAYSVKDYTGIQVVDVNFDLLVNNEIKLKVGTVRPKAMPDGCDVYAMVEGARVRFFTKPKSGILESSSPTQVFGKAK